MQQTITQIAEAFSAGNFQITYPHLAENIQWNIAGDTIIKGKASVIAFCDQTAKYFLEVTTSFTTHNIITGDNCIAIDGTAQFINQQNKRTTVFSCDVYRFQNGQLLQITSYCIKAAKA